MDTRFRKQGFLDRWVNGLPLRAWLELYILIPFRGAVSSIPLDKPRSIWVKFFEWIGFRRLYEGLTLRCVAFKPEYNAGIAGREHIAYTTVAAFNPRTGRELLVKHPFIPANMQSVVTDKLADAVFASGQIIVAHRYFGHKEQLRFVQKYRGRVIACIGIRDPDAETALAIELIEAGALGVLVETTHADHYKAVEIVRKIAAAKPEAQIGLGNIVTFGAALRAIMAGATFVKVGMGPGSPCTTRENGVGFSQASAVAAVCAACRLFGVPAWADGGVTNRFTANVCLALGASMVMLGQMSARSLESALGKLDDSFPFRDDTVQVEKSEDFPLGYKTHYYGEASKIARLRREHGDQLRNHVAEGQGSWIPVCYTWAELVQELTSGMNVALGFTGSRTVAEFHHRVAKHQLVYATGHNWVAESSTNLGTKQH